MYALIISNKCLNILLKIFYIILKKQRHLKINMYILFSFLNPSMFLSLPLKKNKYFINYKYILYL